MFFVLGYCDVKWLNMSRIYENKGFDPNEVLALKPFFVSFQT